MHKKILALLAFAMLSFSTAYAEGITSYERLLLPDYWTSHNKNGEQLLMDDKMIKNFNASIRGVSRNVVHMASYPETINGDSLKTKIMNYQVLEDELYLNGKKVSENYKNILRNQTNVGKIPATVKVRYGVLVRRSNIRNLPTRQGLFYFADDKEFDAIQETALDPCEPVAILHTSANGYFYYVQAYNYSGWIYKFDVATTDRATWLKYVNPTYSLVVTDKKLTLNVKPKKENILFQQGARIPMLSKNANEYVLDIPYCAVPSGPLTHFKLTVPKKEIASKINEGYLRYTTNNLIRMAFKHYNEPYGWGGLQDSVDCSALVNNVYRTVGIYLPRNADEQAVTAGKHMNFDGLDDKARLAHIESLDPGAVLHLDGHCSMYLGTSNDKPFVIHALGSYYQNGERKRAMRVVVSDLSLQRSNGKTHLQEMLSSAQYR